MTDKLHQSISSLLDNQEDDLALPRLLQAMQADSTAAQELGETWRRFHLVQSVLKGEVRGHQAGTNLSVDISARVQAQLALEDTNTANLSTTKLTAAANIPPTTGLTSQWLRGGALAASVALLVITGTQLYNSNQTPTTLPTQAQLGSFKPVNTLDNSLQPSFSLVEPDCASNNILFIEQKASRTNPCSANAQSFSPLISSAKTPSPYFTPVAAQ